MPHFSPFRNLMQIRAQEFEKTAESLTVAVFSSMLTEIFVSMK